MSDRSKIEWTDATWNPVTGCTKVSEGCRNCYAERMVQRFGGAVHGYNRPRISCAVDGDAVTNKPFSEIVLHEDRLEQPLRWRKPRRVFVCSMGDLFHEKVPTEYIAAVFAVMAACPDHTFIVLTKRPERMREWFRWVTDGQHHGGLPMPAGERLEHGAEYMSEDSFDGIVDRWPAGYDWWPLPNAWIGVSVEDQKTADERIPVLLDTPAAVRFVSCEPLLGPVRLRGAWHDYLAGWNTVPEHDPGCDGTCYNCPIPVQIQTNALDWVIVGGESGPGARPMHPDWVRSLRDQCQEAGVPFFFKQWGSWDPKTPNFVFRTFMSSPDNIPSDYRVWRVGKKAAGRELDGRTWDEFPEV